MKVHFACEGGFSSAEALRASDINYILQTFHQIRKQKGKLNATLETINSFKHVIIDSGLFSYMFGCDKNKVIVDRPFCESLYADYIKFINNTNFRNASFVELDLQKKLGADVAWEYRRRMKRDINKGTVINVYHLEDENPDKLIEFSDYIAISIPELRLNVSKKERDRITRYISTKAIKKGKRVHLLGCTEKKMMKAFDYCTTCDSSSWRSGMMYGSFRSEITGDIRIEKIYNNKNIPFDNKARKYDYFAGGVLRMVYEKYAGSQE